MVLIEFSNFYFKLICLEPQKKPLLSKSQWKIDIAKQIEFYMINTVNFGHFIYLIH